MPMDMGWTVERTRGKVCFYAKRTFRKASEKFSQIKFPTREHIPIYFIVYSFQSNDA